MIDKKREIFIRLDKVSEIVEVLEEIRSKEKKLNKLFNEYERLSINENKTFENWSYYLEDLLQKIDHVTL